jgi:rod shape-determining protein MreC
MPRSIRDIALIIILLGLSLVLVFSTGGSRGINAAESVLYRLLRPLDQAMFSMRKSIGNVWQDYIDLVNVKRENRELNEELRRLHREKAELSARESENLRLKKLLDVKNRHEFPSVVAQIIGEDASGWFRTCFINKGTDDGVFAGMPVTAIDGLVGRVSRSAAGMAQVILITDPALAIDCRIARTRERGILRGSLEGGSILRYLNPKAQVQTDDDVVTSGLDGVFPMGLTVGKIQSVRTGDQGLFVEALVRPAVDLSALDEVLVVLSTLGGFDTQSWSEERR